MFETALFCEFKIMITINYLAYYLKKRQFYNNDVKLSPFEQMELYVCMFAVFFNYISF